MAKVDAIVSHKYAAVALPGSSFYSTSRYFSVEIDLISNLDIRDVDNVCGGIFVSSYPNDPYSTGYDAPYGWGVTPFVQYMPTTLRACFVSGTRYDPPGRISLTPSYTSSTWTVGNLSGEIGPAGGVIGKTETAQTTYHQLFINNTNTSIGYMKIWRSPDNSVAYGYPHINIPSGTGYDGSGTDIRITTTDGATTTTDALSAYFVGGVPQTFNFSGFTSYIPSKLSFKLGNTKYYGENGVIKCVSGVSVGASVGTFNDSSMTFSPLPLAKGTGSIAPICITPNNKVYITCKMEDNSFGDFNLIKGAEYTLKMSKDGIYINNTRLSTLQHWPDSIYNTFIIGANQNPADWGGGAAQGINSDIIKEIRIIEHRKDLGTDIITRYYPCEGGVMKEPNDYYTNRSTLYQPDSSFRVAPVNKMPCLVRMRTQSGVQKFSKLIIKSDTNILTNGSGFVQYKE